MKLLHTILARTITGISDKLTHINHGGCGHYAYEVQQALAMQEIDASIVLVDHMYDEEDVAEFIEFVDGAHDITSAIRIRFANGEKNGGYVNPCFGHICVKVDDILYDSDGIHHSRAISDNIEPDAMDLALSADCWNPTFTDYNDDGVSVMRAYIKDALAPIGVCDE